LGDGGDGAFAGEAHGDAEQQDGGVLHFCS
jgi:hypothetical protein